MTKGFVSDEAAKEEILAIKKKLGDKLMILTHHYQRKEVVDVGDHLGDSFGLSQKAAANTAAEFIVFCGVHFMAESAAILARPHQTVQIPEVEAGCWMADMADLDTIEQAWDQIGSVVPKESVMPVVYVNSDAYLKAFCGRNGGTACTSSNTPAAFQWAFGQRQKILFFPDQHLGRNSANSMGIPKDEIIVWSPGKPLGGNSVEQVAKARVVLWDGYCLVHTRFKKEHVLQRREEFPDAKIVVHPECTEDVVQMADAVGSTSYIVQYVKNAPAGAIILVGTEINLVSRLAFEYPDKTILELHRSLCPNMYKINLQNLLRTLTAPGKINVVTVDDKIKSEARLSLDRMLTIK